MQKSIAKEVAFPSVSNIDFSKILRILNHKGINQVNDKKSFNVKLIRHRWYVKLEFAMNAIHWTLHSIFFLYIRLKIILTNIVHDIANFFGGDKYRLTWKIENIEYLKIFSTDHK